MQITQQEYVKGLLFYCQNNKIVWLWQTHFLRNSQGVPRLLGFFSWLCDKCFYKFPLKASYSLHNFGILLNSIFVGWNFTCTSALLTPGDELFTPLLNWAYLVTPTSKTTANWFINNKSTCETISMIRICSFTLGVKFWCHFHSIVFMLLFMFLS